MAKDGTDKSRFKKLRFRKESRFKNDCSNNQNFSTKVDTHFKISISEGKIVTFNKIRQFLAIFPQNCRK